MSKSESVRALPEPLTPEEETPIRDFYARRTTRLSMGSSVLIRRLLTTLDREREETAHWKAVALGQTDTGNLRTGR